MDDKLIQNIMHIIVNSGEAKSSSVEAIRFAKENRFKDAYRKLKDADDLLNEAHNGQTYFLSQEADGKKIDISILLIHCQDHLMNAITFRDMATEMVDLYNKVLNKKEE